MEIEMNVPDYRRLYKITDTWQTDETPLSLLDKVILAGLRALAEDGDYKTFGDVHHEKRWLMNANGLATRHNDETGEREIYMPNGEE